MGPILSLLEGIVASGSKLLPQNRPTRKGRDVSEAAGAVVLIGRILFAFFFGAVAGSVISRGIR
jgi:hypothetical protein